jgi:hypothetical protein
LVCTKCTSDIDGHFSVLSGDVFTNNKGASINIHGTTAANGNTKRLQIKSDGGTKTLYDSGLVAANNKPYALTVHILGDASSEQAYVTGVFNGGVVCTPVVACGTGLGLPTDVGTVLTNGTASAGDISEDFFEVIYH